MECTAVEASSFTRTDTHTRTRTKATNRLTLSLSLFVCLPFSLFLCVPLQNSLFHAVFFFLCLSLYLSFQSLSLSLILSTSLSIRFLFPSFIPPISSLSLHFPYSSPHPLSYIFFKSLSSLPIYLSLFNTPPYLSASLSLFVLVSHFLFFLSL